MSVELGAPPRPVADRCSYKEIIRRVVEADGEWLRLTLDEVAPEQTIPVKQTRLWQAGTTRGIKVQTTVQDGFIFVRLRKGKVQADDCR